MQRSEASRSKTVLVVEDDQDTRQELRRCLEDEGFQVVEAVNGQAALDYLVTTGEESQPGLVILDFKMPSMSGESLLAIMRSYVRLSDLPVIFASGEPMPPTVAARSVAAYLRKPIDCDQLVLLARRYFRSQTAKA